MIVHDHIPGAGGREEKTEHPTWKLSSLVRLWRWRVSDSAMPPEDYIRWTSLVEAGVRVSSNRTTVLITAYVCVVDPKAFRVFAPRKAWKMRIV
ncbi:hypothetical protein NC651_011694 [Populus alba x Populus x berolinensis]|nr:hypothetical protein NC651_011694 [Populus alba x Populus x berolinensis]